MDRSVGIVFRHVSFSLRRVGIVSSASYRHFRNKDELLDAVLDYVQQRLLGNVKKVSDQTAEPLEQLKRLIALHVRLILEHQALPRILFSEEVYGGRPEKKAKLYAIIKGYLAEVASIVRQGQQENRIRPELNPDTVSIMYLGLIQAPAILWHLSGGGFDVAKHVERAWPVFSEAISSKGSLKI